ncbi:MAG: hypothetical protein NC177_17905, partial [Ruminococcus flavefaciens]|nr:hypothetical protein [Ruminococcus flavefaciens]
MESIYHQNWEQELMYQFIKNDKCRRKAYVCSPLGAEKEDEFVQNMRAARAYMFYAMKKMNLNARAPHAYLPMLLCDQIPAERALGLQFGLRLMENCEIMLICGNRISQGMRGEIEQAVKLGISMIVFDEGVYIEVRKIVTQVGGNKRNVQLDCENYPMAYTSPVSY